MLFVDAAVTQHSMASGYPRGRAGAFRQSRVIDLSQAAAEQLQFSELAPVSLETLNNRDGL
jgi:hypothetical protein